MSIVGVAGYRRPATKFRTHSAVLLRLEDRCTQPAVMRPAFSSDGTKIAVASGYRVQITRVFPTPQDLIAFARSVVPRQLTPCERRRFFLPAILEIALARVDAMSPFGAFQKPPRALSISAFRAVSNMARTAGNFAF